MPRQSIVFAKSSYEDDGPPEIGFTRFRAFRCASRIKSDLRGQARGGRIGTQCWCRALGTLPPPPHRPTWRALPPIQPRIRTTSVRCADKCLSGLAAEGARVHHDALLPSRENLG